MGQKPKVCPFFGPRVSHGVRVLATRIPSEASMLTFGGIASFVAVPVFLRAKRMDCYLLARLARETA